MGDIRYLRLQAGKAVNEVGWKREGGRGRSWDKVAALERTLMLKAHGWILRPKPVQPSAGI
ncbi:hypothetical protein L218DRAFT_1001908 [Marasmius fiardii PR-910]|nr:hypothetical protein L218DRAFT_1001908 [Marasmius fiardii PR-910]